MNYRFHEKMEKRGLAQITTTLPTSSKPLPMSRDNVVSQNPSSTAVADSTSNDSEHPPKYEPSSFEQRNIVLEKPKLDVEDRADLDSSNSDQQQQKGAFLPPSLLDTATSNMMQITRNNTLLACLSQKMQAAGKTSLASFTGGALPPSTDAAGNFVLLQKPQVSKAVTCTNAFIPGSNGQHGMFTASGNNPAGGDEGFLHIKAG